LSSRGIENTVVEYEKSGYIRNGILAEVNASRIILPGFETSI
jgi:hypothetical protein